MKEITDRRYPIGKFEYGKNYTIEETRKQIKAIARLPKALKKTLKKLKDGALDKSYRAGGWTARQVLHHLADSHMNAYARFKLAATENTPIIKPYEENLWAEMEDAKHGSPKPSLKILSALHTRWVDFLMSLSDDDLDRGYYHPSNKRTVSLREAIALYAWHSKHHLAHVKIVASGNLEKVSGAKKSKTKGEKPADKEPGAKSPKRVMSEAHKAKIRAAQQARRAAEKAGKPNVAKTAAAVSGPKKRGPKPAAKPIEEVKKLGRPVGGGAKINVKSPAVPKKATPEKTRRARRSSAEVAAEKAAKAAMPKLSRAEVLAKARAARMAKSPAAPKKAKPEKPKRARRSSAEVAAEKAAKAAMPKLSRAEVMAKARAAAAANRAAKGETAKPKKDPNAPVLSRAEVLAKARAARQSKK